MFSKRYQLEIVTWGENIRENSIEALGVGCLSKDVEYRGSTPFKRKYHDVLLTKDELKDVYTKLNEMDESSFIVNLVNTESMEFNSIIEVYSDGSCTSRKDPVKLSSSGYLLVHYDSEDGILDYKEDSSKQEEGTNSVGELTALVESSDMVLGYLKDKNLSDKTLVIFNSDSEYVIKGFTTHLKKQIERGWKNTSGKPVKYKDLWLRLIDNVKELEGLGVNVQFKWVKAHKLLKEDINNCSDLETFIPLLDEYEDPNRRYYMNERCDILAKGILGK